MASRDSAHHPMNILMASCVPRRREGGVAVIIYNLGRELEALGHSVTYVFQEDLVEREKILPRFVELVFSLRLAKYIAKRRSEFSIVNLHAPVGFPYGWRRRWSPRAGWPPYVMTLHGLEERRTHVMSREQRLGRAWNYSWKNRLWHRFYHHPRFRWSIRAANGAHTISRDAFAFLQLVYNMDSDRVAYVPSGVEARFFVPREYREGQDLRLLYAGTWLDQRGIFYIRDALRNLAPRLPGLTMTFAGGAVPAGEIEDFFGADLRSRISVRPVVSADDMPKLYAEHDVLLFPSLMEGLPSVLLEAMASGMPVVTTETCGMPDVVEDELNGLLIPPANAAAIENAIARLAKSAELRRTLGTAARESMRRYTWARSARRLEVLFRHIIERENSSQNQGAA
jgi:glycosyltransferase involved in cell wall biosynthesis